MAKIFLMVVFMVFGSDLTGACAQDPPSWPWKGITISSVGSAPEDIRLAKSRIDYNTISLTINARFFAKIKGLDPEDSWTKSIAWADAMLDACRDSGIQAVLTISQFPIDPSLGLTQASPEFWGNQAQLDEVVYRVGLLAGHFKNRGAELVAYDVLNEPVVDEGGRMTVPAQWPDLMEKIIKEIRLRDAERWIVVTPGPGGMAQGYAGFKPIKDNNIIYGAHMYIPHAFTHQGIHGRPLGLTYPGRINLKFWNKKAFEGSLSDLRAFQQRYDVPVWIGEFSAARWAPGSDKYLLDLVSIFNKWGWGWAYFNIRGYHGWNPDYDTGYSTDRREDWQSHFVGENSLRWDTLKKMFELP